MIDLYQVYYNDETKQHLDSQFTPYFNVKCTKYFVDQVMVDMCDAGLMQNSDYFGVWSWRAKQKIKFWPNIRGLIHQYPGYDYYYVALNEHCWEHCNKWQGDDCSVWCERILAEIGWPNIKVLEIIIPLSTYSYHICKTDIYREYVSSFLKPFMRVLDEEKLPGMREWLYGANPYFRHSGANALTPEQLVDICGVPHYSKHVFMTECLFGTYVALKNLKGKAIAESNGV